MERIRLYAIIAWMWTKYCVSDAARRTADIFFVVLSAAILVFHKVFLTAPSRTWRAFKLFIFRLGFVIAIGSRYYKNWSRLYQWLYERKHKSLEIEMYTSYRALSNTLATCTWIADGSKELGDAISSPGFIQYVINEVGGRPIGDCDEFAMYNAAALMESVKMQMWTGEPIKNCSILTVRWMQKDTPQVQAGHNVCLIELVDGTYRYMDYWSPSPAFKTKREVALRVIDDYTGVDKSDCLGWSVSDRVTMSPTEIHWK